MDAIDEGALIATVTKKRRGNTMETTGANFDINVGEGRYISLNDPSGVQNLDSEMKTSAMSQLKVLQDQMACLMQQLSTTDTTAAWEEQCDATGVGCKPTYWSMECFYHSRWRISGTLQVFH